MTTLQAQNRIIEQRLFEPIQKLATESNNYPELNRVTELEFKIQKSKHFDPNYMDNDPSLNFQAFNGTSGMKQPISNKSLYNYYIRDPASQLWHTEAARETTAVSLQYPGMQQKDTHFPESEIVVSNALRMQSRSRTHNPEENVYHQQPIHYDNEIHTNDPNIWDNNNRIKKSCEHDILKKAVDIFDIQTPALHQHQFLTPPNGVLLNSRDLIRNKLGSTR